ncbi:long-chain-fatty-acid--CoA ligase [Bacillus dakarensis]|uniref:long-chain-fatty-acid--CoA ligase n=1 Tax=Robertmurraya dakarensis TaxID=1926278 RepID=UPI000981CDB7|nr:long-chain fatty acid--CoA ligase [Bacillus dakarensis]
MKRPWLAFYPEAIPHEITAPSISIYHILSDSTELVPNNVAVIQDDIETTYTDLKRYVDCLASSLAEGGFKKGDLLAIMLPNCIEYIIAFFAVQRLGGIVVQVNPMYQPRELEHILEDSGASWFVTYQEQVEKLEKIGYLNELNLIIADGATTEKNHLYSMIKRGKNPPPAADVDAENDVAILQYTGGTTGRSKGVMVTHHNVISNLYQIMAQGAATADENENITPRGLGIAPMFHAMGLTGMSLTIFAGGTFIPIKRFVLDEVVECIKKYRPTSFSGSPTMYIALLNHPRITSEDLQSIKTYSSGSAPLSVEVMTRFEEISKNSISEGYGLSEATTMVTKNPSVGVRKPGSVGIPVSSTDCRIVDVETGLEDVETGQTGELIIKGPQVMKGYWKNEEETAKALRDGWLYTGDLAVMDEDGYIFIVGRKKDMIIASGYNIYPIEIEEVLYKMPQVKEVCVYGVPDPYRGETVKAAILLKDNAVLTEQEVEDWCNQNLARYKVPRQIEFWDELPKTAVGKILRTKLIEMEKEKLAEKKN